MKNHTLTQSALGCAITLILGLPLTAQADIKIENTIHFGGVFGMAANDTATTMYIQGLKKREESNTKFTGSVLGTLQKWKHGDKGSNSVVIMRVDENKVYTLDPDEKTYDEHPMYQPEKKKGETGTSTGKEDKDTKIIRNDVEVKDTGKTQKINGFDTHEYLVTWNLETENTKTHERAKSLMTTDMWNATEAKLDKARQEQTTYTLAYMKLMHLPMTADDLKQFGFNNVTLSGADSKAFMDKFSKIKGYPISMDVSWKASDTGAPASGTHPATESSQDVAKTLGNLFGSKDDKDSKPDADGMSTVFTSHMEVKSVATDALSKDLFEVPDGYKQD